MTEFRTLFQIPADNLASFEDKLAKLSKRSVRMGCGEILPFIASNELKDFGRDIGKVRVYNVHLMADTPKIDGWVFAARLDHSQETGTLIRSVPNFSRDIPTKYRDAAPHCDHCTVRRYRRDSYIVCNEETGAFAQVGSSCLADFMGHDAYKIARLAEYLSQAGEYARLGEQFVGADRRFLDVEEFLVSAAGAIRLYGWASAKFARDREDVVPTRDHAESNSHRRMGKSGYGTCNGWYEYFDTTDEDRQMAADALAYVLAFADKPVLSEYESNVLVIAKAVSMEYRHAGLAASIVGIYHTHLNRAALQKATEGKKASAHVGQPGDKVEFGTARVTSARPTET
ncbi:MAG: hypothetical protein EOP83_16990 [Verrucomicrobiaceae bacterium]|nr:MAG: hypothetical protein EOP83_16990 [Verrucomicrobiaceae bacterium]